MPIYEYECQRCGHIFELFQAMNSDPPRGCSDCGGRVERILSSPSLNLGKFTSRSAARHARQSVDQQAKQEQDRLIEHSKKTGIPYEDLFEAHE
jgi:putative FmdB family regulatory protein